MDIWFPDQISEPPIGWRSAVRGVAMFLPTMEGHRRGLPLGALKASFKGQCRSLEATQFRDAWVVVPRSPSSIDEYVCPISDRHPQLSSHIVGMLSPMSSGGPCRLALGKEMKRHQTLIESFSSK